jgi:hypothetical protein
LKERIYQAPASLPNLSPALLGIKVPSIDSHINSLDDSPPASPRGGVNGAASSTDTYDGWLAYQRSTAADKSRVIRGRDLDTNYSYIDFNNESIKVQQLSQLLSQNTLPILEVPSAIGPLINVEIFTQNHLIRSNAVLEEETKSVLTKQLPSNISFDDLRTIVIKDIVIGIGRAFQLDNKMLTTNNNSSLNLHGSSNNNREESYWLVNSIFSSEKIELLFHFYNRAIYAWKIIHNETDWIQAIHLSNLPPANKLSIMYSIEKNSEMYILRMMKEFQESKHKKLQDRDKDHVSLRQLTDSLSGTGSATRNNNWKESLINSCSLTPKSPNNKRAITANGPPLINNKSILYPPPSEYQKMKERNEILNQRQELIAQQLEQKLLKTRW